MRTARLRRCGGVGPLVLSEEGFFALIGYAALKYPEDVAGRGVAHGPPALSVGRANVELVPGMLREPGSPRRRDRAKDARRKGASAKARFEYMAARDNYAMRVNAEAAPHDLIGCSGEPVDATPHHRDRRPFQRGGDGPAWTSSGPRQEFSVPSSAANRSCSYAAAG